MRGGGGMIFLNNKQWCDIVKGLEGAQVGIEEAFAELGGKRVADWEKMNDGLRAKDRALALVRKLAPPQQGREGKCEDGEG